MADGTRVGGVYLDLSLNKKPFDRSMNSLQGGLGGLASKLGGKLAAGLSIAAFAKFGQACLSAGSNLEEVQNVVDNAFPTMNKQINGWAQNAITQFGMSETVAKRMSGTFGAMATSFGFTEGQAANMATTLTGLAADVASFYNLNHDEAYTKLKSVFTGETESLKDLGVVMTQANLDQYALANGFGKTTAAMTESEKVALRYQFVQSQLATASGDFARTSDSWANQTRILAMQFESLKASLGQSFIAVLSPLLKWFNALMVKIVQAAQAFATFIKTITGSKSADSTTKNIASNLGVAADGANGVGTGLGKAQKAAEKLKRSLMGFDSINKLDDSSSSSSSGGVTSGGVGGGITSGVTDIGFETAEIEEGSSKVAEILDSLKKRLEPLAEAFDKLKEAGKGFAERVSEALKYAWDSILKPFIDWFIDKFVGPFTEFCASIVELFNGVWDVLAPIFKSFIEDWLKPIAEMQFDALIAILEWLTDGFNGLADDLKAAGEWLDNLFETLRDPNFLSSLKAEISFKMAQTVDQIKQWWNERVETIKDVAAIISASMAQTADQIKNWWNDRISNVKDASANISAKMAQTAKQVKDWWNERIEHIKGKSADMNVKMAQTVKQVKEWWDERIEHVKDKTAEMKAKVASTFSGDLKTKWNKLIANFKDKTASMKAKVGSSFSGDLKKKWNNLLGSFKDKTVKIKLALDTAAANFKDWINTNVIGKINSKINSVKWPVTGKNVFPKDPIPRLAQGGYVKANTPQLAMIGDNTHYGEIVAPENKLQAMADRAAAKGNMSNAKLDEVINLLQQLVAKGNDVYLDGRKVTSTVVSNVNAIKASTGRSPILV